MVDEIIVSENSEALIVLAGTVLASVGTFIASLPFPIEYKAPVVALFGAVSAAVLIYWKAKVNKPKV